MKIVVCIKQVPDTSDVRWSKENNIIREGLLSILNPCDEYGIRVAVDIKKEHPNTQITLLSMGPNQAKEILEYGMAIGANRAILLSDKIFQGSDTVATSKTISCAVSKFLDDFDLIICGQYAIDGDTAQTGPSIAVNLDIPVVGFVKKIIKIDKEKTVVRCEKENQIQIIEIKNPSLICVLKENNEFLAPKINDYIRAQSKNIEVYNAEDIGLNPDEAGIKGSPTFVFKAFRPEIKRSCEFIENNYIEKTQECLNNKITPNKTLQEGA